VTRTRVLSWQAAIASLAGVTVVASAGCSGSSLDKAGGAQAANPVVLTMANINGPSEELQPFASAAAQLSGNTLRIEFKNNWRTGSTGNETGLIADVGAGKADLGWAGSRAFDSVGVKSFDALNAPLLIDSYPLEAKVLASSMVGPMLTGLKPLGLVGLGILPGPMRKPLGVWPLVRPQDYRGKTVAYSRSQIAEETLRALGATGVEIPAGGPIDAYDGVEQQIAAIEGNSYDSVAPFLTANVNLWPRPLVLFMNHKAFETLTSEQQTSLSRAAAAAAPSTLAIQKRGQSDATTLLCRRGLSLLTATDSDLAALRQAVQPVYTQLEGDAQTRAAIGQITTMRRQSDSTATPDSATCAGAGVQSPAIGQATAIDGVYSYHTTADELRAAGADPVDVIPENYGDFQTVFNRGLFTQAQPMGDKEAGTFLVVGNKLTMTVTQGSGGPAHDRPGEVFTYYWSLYRDQLTLREVPGQVSPVGLTLHAWTRLGDAP
jgi:TRAP-type transport system periplasmic protein